MDKKKPLNIFVDIDDTIANTSNQDYKSSKPYPDRIKVINKLYDEGNHITYWTARGTVSKIDWYDTTKEQLNKWGAKHHKLLMGKPAFDLFIDDKVMNTKTFFDNIKLD
jgi:CMP-N,N'-diacetyllegionaminic acid synthase